jgi:hypothetical protein
MVNTVGFVSASFIKVVTPEMPSLDSRSTRLVCKSRTVLSDESNRYNPGGASNLTIAGVSAGTAVFAVETVSTVANIGRSRKRMMVLSVTVI